MFGGLNLDQFFSGSRKLLNTQRTKIKMEKKAYMEIARLFITLNQRPFDFDQLVEKLYMLQAPRKKHMDPRSPIRNNYF